MKVAICCASAVLVGGLLSGSAAAKPKWARQQVDPYSWNNGWSGSNLPPGLAKRNGNLPPGLQKHLDRTGHLPPGLEKRYGTNGTWGYYGQPYQYQYRTRTWRNRDWDRDRYWRGRERY